MARPCTLTPEQITRVRESPLAPTQLVGMLLAEGIRVSKRTIQRALAGKAKTPDRAAAHAAYVAAAIAGDDIALMVSARQVISESMVEWHPLLGSDPRAVRAYATLTRALGDLAKRIAELAPPPTANPDHDPACLKAKARLLELADEVLTR